MSDASARALDLRDQLQASLGATYTIERELGAGGMSRVFVAREEGLARDVVIKVLSPQLSAALSAERFTREIRLAASLQEPHIVPVLSAGVTREGLPYYMMPYVRGNSLRTRLGTERLPFSEISAILRNVAQALAHAHAQGVVHRDIKPENVLLSSGTAVVTDFGIAKALAASKTEAPGGTLTQAGSSLGTPAYMAPEQAAGDDVDARADLYSWGVMAYEMLAGQHPFHDRTTAQQLLAAHIAERPKPLLDVLPQAQRHDAPTRAFAELVMRCLEKQPSGRPESAAAVLAEIDSPVQRRPPARSRTMMIGVGVVALTAVVLGTFLRTRTTPEALLEPKRVVVATFENKSGDASLDPLGAMAADWIARGLIGTGLVDVGGTSADLAARGVVSRVRAGESPLLALARDAKAGIVISGAYYRQGDSVLFQADFTDANAGSLVQTVGPISALATAPLNGVELLRQRVIGSLAPFVDSMLAMQASVMSRPPSLEAYRELLTGERLFYSDEEAATRHYTRAAAADTTFAAPLLRAIIVYQNRGDQAPYDSLRNVLAPRRDRLTPYEQAYLDYVTCENSPERSACIPATREMVRLTPKSQFTPYLVAIMLRWGNRPRAADSILRTLDPESGELRGRIYFVLHHASVLHVVGEHERELAVARRGRELYRGRLYPVITEIAALVALGRLDEADRVIDGMFSLAPDIRSSALWYGALAIHEFRWHGHAAAADSLGEKLLARLAARRASDVLSPADVLGRAGVLTAMHRWRDLEALSTELLAADRSSVIALRSRGIALAMQGKRAEAATVDSVLANEKSPLRPDDACYGVWRCRDVARAYIAAALGDKARAVALLDFRYFNDRFAHYDLIGELLRDYLPFQDYIKPRG